MITHPRLVSVVAVGMLAIGGLLPLALAGPFRLPVRTAQFGKETPEPPLPGQQKMPPPPPYHVQPMMPVPVVPGPFLSPSCGSPCPVDPPAPLVKIKVRVAACSAAGQEIEYQICVENCSPAAAHHVIVRNPLPVNARFVRANPEPSMREPELAWTFGTLPPGACREISLVLAPTDTADVKNCARVQFEHGQCVVTRIAKSPPMVTEKEPPKVIPMDPAFDPKEPPKVIVPSDVKLGVKITGPAQQYANLPVKYQITVTNATNAVAENVLITAFLPEQSTFVEASDKGRFHFSQVAWLIGDVPAGASRTVQVVYKVPAAGEYCLKAMALPERGLRGEDSFCTKFQGVSALLLEVVDSKDPVEIGGQTSYKIIVFNQGSASLTNVQVKAYVPRELLTIRATGPTEPGPKLPEPTPNGQLVPYPPLKELKAGERQVFEVLTQAVRVGDARFRVVLTADELLLGGPVLEEESTQVFSEQ
jgi:uncharacterized repeat protein (TIGR01451 family)